VWGLVISRLLCSRATCRLIPVSSGAQSPVVTSSFLIIRRSCCMQGLKSAAWDSQQVSAQHRHKNPPPKLLQITCNHFQRRTLKLSLHRHAGDKRERSYSSYWCLTSALESPYSVARGFIAWLLKFFTWIQKSSARQFLRHKPECCSNICITFQRIWWKCATSKLVYKIHLIYCNCTSDFTSIIRLFNCTLRVVSSDMQIWP
jgi:hypothetical protein